LKYGQPADHQLKKQGSREGPQSFRDGLLADTHGWHPQQAVKLQQADCFTPAGPDLPPDQADYDSQHN
jgi:hypothetical protein